MMYNNIKKYIDFTNEGSFTPFSNKPNGKRPKTNEELKNDYEISLFAMKSFDNIFGTNFHTNFKNDLSSLVKDPSINIITSEDVINKLKEIAYDPNYYLKFKYSFDDNNLNNVLYSLILSIDHNLHPITVLLNKTFKYKPRNKKFWYIFFKEHGHYFSPEIVSKCLKIKKGNPFGINNNGNKLNPDIQKYFILAFNWGINHFKDWINLNKLIELSTDKFIELTSKKEFEIIKEFIDNKYNEWINILKNNNNEMIKKFNEFKINENNNNIINEYELSDYENNYINSIHNKIKETIKSFFTKLEKNTSFKNYQEHTHIFENDINKLKEDIENVSYKLDNTLESFESTMSETPSDEEQAHFERIDSLRVKIATYNNELDYLSKYINNFNEAFDNLNQGIDFMREFIEKDF